MLPVVSHKVKKWLPEKADATKEFRKLLAGLFNSNSQVNGHTDHGHELARRRWRSQGQAQCVLRSASEEGASSPTRAPGTANGTQ